MTLEQLIAQFRTEADDAVAPGYLFKTDLVKGWINEAETEAATRSRLLYEDADAYICQIPVLAGTATVNLDDAVIDIAKAFYTPAGGTKVELYLIDRLELDRINPHWRDSTDAPLYLVQDDSAARIVPTPTTDAVLSIECYRTPIREMVQLTDKPEISGQHHRHLINWALFRAFSVPDAETRDDDRAQRAEMAFTKHFGLRPDATIRRDTQANRPHFNKAW